MENSIPASKFENSNVAMRGLVILQFLHKKCNFFKFRRLHQIRRQKRALEPSFNLENSSPFSRNQGVLLREAEKMPDSFASCERVKARSRDLFAAVARSPTVDCVLRRVFLETPPWLRKWA